VVFSMKESSVGLGLGVVSTMVFWWITQPVPLYITGLIPIAVGPIFGLVTNEQLAFSYGNHMIFLFLGGFIMALGIEKWKLHEYISIRLIRFFGNSPVRILIGFMVATAFMSMWISNTATTLMMLPMAMSVIKSVKGDGKTRFATGLLISIAYAANIGGTATIIGTPPNVQLAGILAQNYNIHIDFFEWLKLGLPFSIIMNVIAFLFIKQLFFRNLSLEMPDFESTRLDKEQKIVLITFTFIVFLWMFAKPILEPFGVTISDTAIAVFGGFMFFVLPGQEGRSLLVWKDMDRIPWGILILFGGGLAVAQILANTGVISELVNSLSAWSTSSIVVIILLLITITVFATELMSNLALVSLLIPIVATFSLEFNLPLVLLCSGVALASSCAFMLPVATPPNAIVYSSNMIPIKKMVQIGVYLNIVVVLIISFFLLLY
jgi:solute carrier family 13 (sodium-dependent dicarboxylate transporter), member 2/3/5